MASPRCGSFTSSDGRWTADVLDRHERLYRAAASKQEAVLSVTSPSAEPFRYVKVPGSERSRKACPIRKKSLNRWRYSYIQVEGQHGDYRLP